MPVLALVLLHSQVRRFLHKLYKSSACLAIKGSNSFPLNTLSYSQSFSESLPSPTHMARSFSQSRSTAQAAIAERAWHRAAWELDYKQGVIFDEASTYVDKGALNNDLNQFVDALAQRELAKIDTLVFRCTMLPACYFFHARVYLNRCFVPKWALFFSSTRPNGLDFFSVLLLSPNGTYFSPLLDPIALIIFFCAPFATFQPSLSLPGAVPHPAPGRGCQGRPADDEHGAPGSDP